MYLLVYFIFCVNIIIEKKKKKDEEILEDSFLNNICEDERETVQIVLAIDAKESIFESEDFLDILDRFKCRSKVTKFDARNIITELAKQELIQNPHLMAH